MKLNLNILSLVALATSANAAPGNGGGGPKPKANLGLCYAQASCIEFVVKKAEGSTCTSGDACGIEVCMILDTTIDGCAKEGPISHICAASNGSGCAAYGDDGATPLTGKGDNGDCTSTIFDGKCEPESWGSPTRIEMCQTAEPGQTVYWGLKDSDSEDTGFYDYTASSNFTYAADDGTDCYSPKISCFGNTTLACADPASDMHLSTRVWSYEIPANDDTSCDLCDNGGTPVSSPAGPTPTSPTGATSPTEPTDTTDTDFVKF